MLHLESCVQSLPLHTNDEWKIATHVQALRTEVKQCIEKVEKLSEEFEEIKSNVQETLEEVDKTRCAVTELTVKLLSSN